MGLADSISKLYVETHQTTGLPSVGEVPSGLEFVNLVDRIEDNIKYKFEHTFMDHRSLMTYLQGYIEGSLEGLVERGWNNLLVYKFLAIYLSVKYIDRYIICKTSTWKSSLAKELSRYYGDDFAEQFMEVHYDEFYRTLT